MSFRGKIYRFLARRYLLSRCNIEPSDLRRSTEGVVSDFIRAVQSASDTALRRTAGDGWNAGEVAFHAMHTANTILMLCKNLQKDVPAPDVSREQIGKTQNATREQILEIASDVRTALEDVDYAMSAGSRAAHPWFGRLSSRQWLVLNLVHLERHLKQLDRALTHA